MTATTVMGPQATRRNESTARVRTAWRTERESEVARASQPIPAVGAGYVVRPRESVADAPEPVLDALLASPPAIRADWRYRLKHSPPWLVSGIVHFVALLVLALWLPAVIHSRATVELTFVAGKPVEREAVMALPSLEMAEPSFLPTESLAAAPPLPADPTADLAVSEIAPLTWSAGSSSAGSGFESLLGDGSAGPAGIGGIQKQAEFFGVQAKGERFVFIVDSSRSMQGDKFRAAKKELRQAVRRLDSDQSFYVIFFDNNIQRISLRDDGQPESDFVPLTDANVAKFDAWLDGIECEPWTNPHEALQIAIGLKPDVVFLLSDGEFTDRGQTMRYLAKERVRRDPETKEKTQLVIHTVGFYERDGEKGLRKIAQQFRGQYRFVPPPDDYAPRRR